MLAMAALAGARRRAFALLRRARLRSALDQPHSAGVAG